MDIIQFNEELNNINKNSWGYGNEILYYMAKDPNDLKDKDKLAGAIWLIGRAYAASPQRRSYGKTKTGKKYKNFDGKDVTRPIWPVKTQNDGREGFFDDIAKNTDISCLDTLIKKSNSFSYKFDLLINNNSSDKQLLIDSIVAVLSFNKSLRAAIEVFDGVDQLVDHMFDGEYVSCNNHISFVSKFLHFYFPKIVFIIDNFAYNGGCYLFNGSENEPKRRNFNIPPTKTEYFNQVVYDNLPKSHIKNLVDDITKNVKKSLDFRVEGDSKNINNVDSDDQLEGKHYIEHCVRSYLIGCYLTQKKIIPINQMKCFPNIQIQSMPRLTDAIFLNIKKALTPKEEAYQKSLEETFYKK